MRSFRFFAARFRRLLNVAQSACVGHNLHMEVAGRVQNGVVVFDRPMALPEGASVVVTYRETPVIHIAKNPRTVVLPIFDSGQPGTLDLTNDRIAEILDHEDASS